MNSRNLDIDPIGILPGSQTVPYTTQKRKRPHKIQRDIHICSVALRYALTLSNTLLVTPAKRHFATQLF